MPETSHSRFLVGVRAAVEGASCSAVKSRIGTYATIDLATTRGQGRSTTSPARSIFLQGPAWRIDSKMRTLASSDDEGGDSSLTRLIGRRITGVEMPSASHDLSFDFDGLVLRTFRVDHADAVTVFDPETAWTAGGGALKVERRRPPE